MAWQCAPRHGLDLHEVRQDGQRRVILSKRGRRAHHTSNFLRQHVSMQHVSVRRVPMQRASHKQRDGDESPPGALPHAATARACACACVALQQVVHPSPPPAA
eukprot:359827-Chlamydomonas_euryale.AAC.2